MLTPRGIPCDARIFSLARNKKIPAGGHAHYDAVAVADLIDLGQNVAIRLDPLYLVVDIDHDAPAWERELPATWTQRTPGGTHYLFTVPSGWRGYNQKITVGTNGSTKILGDIKVNGYIVAPGSYVDADRGRPAGTYELLDRRDPVPAPDWLLALCTVKPSEDILERYGGVERELILRGENDNALASIAGFLRSKGFSKDFIARAIQNIGDDPGLMEQDERWLYKAHDYERIAAQMQKKPAGSPDLLLDFGLLSGSDVDLYDPPLRWWVYGFIPQNELVMLYGRGGVGKSSFASWLAARVTAAMHERMLFSGVEEPFKRFLHRAVLMGADRSHLFSYPNASKLKLPRDVDKVAALVEEYKLKVLYFDSINTHFQAPEGTNAAERARHCLGPLAELAQSCGVTIIGAFHENKAGDYLGSVEMENVGRYLLHCTRKPKQPMLVKVKKTNLIDPEVALVFEGEKVPLVVPETGEALLEYRDDAAEPTPREITIVRRAEDRPLNKVDLPTDEDGTIGLDEITAPKRGKLPVNLPFA